MLLERFQVLPHDNDSASRGKRVHRHIDDSYVKYGAEGLLRKHYDSLKPQYAD